VEAEGGVVTAGARTEVGAGVVSSPPIRSTIGGAKVTGAGFGAPIRDKSG
jgi:hypothetical protein